MRQISLRLDDQTERRLDAIREHLAQSYEGKDDSLIGPEYIRERMGQSELVRQCITHTYRDIVGNNDELSGDRTAGAEADGKPARRRRSGMRP